MEDSLATEQETKKNQRHCDKCDFTCYKMSNWLRHVSTAKHIQSQSINKKVPNVCLCGKQYFDRSGLWKHSKKCVFILDLADPVELSESKKLEDSKDLVEPVVSQDLLQELIAENKVLNLLVLKLAQKLYL